MKFNVISNHHNGYGLEDDYNTVKRVIESCRHEVVPVQFDRKEIGPADINLFLEVVVPDFHQFARENWIIPNPEWFNHCHINILPSYEKVICRTLDCYRIFRALTDKAVYTGFENDFYCLPQVKRELSFMHVAGQSVVKNTEAVIDAWNDYGIPYHLDLITSKYQFTSRVRSEKVSTHMRVSEWQYAMMLNRNLIHLCPSKYEGWGHSIHDARSVGAVVITTDAPPMHEFSAGRREYLVPAVAEGEMRQAVLWRVEAESIAETVMKVAAMDMDDLIHAGRENMLGLMYDRKQFRMLFKEVITQTEGRLCAI